LSTEQNRASSAETLDAWSGRLVEFMRADLSPAERADAEFNRLALELFALQFENVAIYRHLCRARSATPTTVTGWKEIPTVPTKAFKEFELSSLTPSERTHVFYSSGTTGQKTSRHFHNRRSLAIYEESLRLWFERQVLPEHYARIDLADQSVACSVEPLSHQVKSGPREGLFSLVALVPPPEQAPHSSLVHMFETVRRAFSFAGASFFGRSDRLGNWTLDLQQLVHQLKRSMIEERAVLMVGTAFSYVHLLDHLAETGLSFRVPPGSRVLETGGYKGRSRTLAKSDLHDGITEAFGIEPSHLISEYGMCELSSQAYDGFLPFAGTPGISKGVERSFRFPPWARVRVISPETGTEVKEGETGLVRVHDLANVFSVAAIQTEDLGIRRGATFELVGRAVQAEPRGCSLMTP
jgi:hypothetical protein